MGMLLDFSSATQSKARAAPRRNTREGTLSAKRGEVLFFPGVRYDRQPLETSSRIGTINETASLKRPDQD
ncbi:MAG: hypothetical protein HWE23_01600 [Rhodobacteraceae bacterium]|nr:hypothetical protein [Paracoccaceae bacterium]